MNRIGVKAAALIIGLPLFLWACEKDLGEREAGKKVTINFTVGNEGYGADQQILKSGGAKEAKPETVYMPLNDNYFIAATLTPEPVGEVRATAAFETGQKIRFVAYNGAVEDDSAIYTWNGSKFVPDGDPLGVEPDNGVTYHFVAYSFFGDPTAEPDDEDVEEGILPAQDLVWGEKNQEIHDNETSRTVSILMKHKFSRVRVKVDASSITDAQVTRVSGVVIAGGKKADLTVTTGAVAASSAAADVTAAMTNWVSVDGGKARQSDCVVFYPSLTTITLAAVDLEIEGVPLPLTNKSVTFAQALAENTSYTVVVDVRANRWAWSNIYWVATTASTGYMTFDKTLVAVEHQYYEGIHFKWGSLVGGASTLAVLYIPDDVSERTWVGPKTISEIGWTTYQDIPFNNDYASTTGSYLHLHNDFDAYIGDICDYIDDEWRMPSADEAAVVVDYGSIVGGGVVSTCADGTGMITHGCMYKGSSGFAFFPASGYVHGLLSGYGGMQIYYNTGSPSLELTEVGQMGMWRDAWAFASPTFNQHMVLSDTAPRFDMRSVRCIKKLPGE